MTDPHTLWAVAQLLPGEGIEDGVARIAALLAESRDCRATDTAEQFGMSKYASTADRNAAMVDEITRLRAEITGLRKSASLRVQFHAAELADVMAELANARAIDIHSCHAGCTRAGCVAAGLRAEVAGLREDAAGLREDAAGLRAFIASDPWAITYQTLGQYRTALLRKIDGAQRAAP